MTSGETANNLKAILLRNIFSGVYKPGVKMPSIRKLAKSYNASPTTVCKSLDSLENDDHLIFTQKNVGKFVVKDKNAVIQKKEEYYNDATRKFIEFVRNITNDSYDEILLEIERYLRQNND